MRVHTKAVLPLALISLPLIGYSISKTRDNGAELSASRINSNFATIDTRASWIERRLESWDQASNTITTDNGPPVHGAAFLTFVAGNGSEITIGGTSYTIVDVPFIVNSTKSNTILRFPVVNCSPTPNGATCNGGIPTFGVKISATSPEFIGNAEASGYPANIVYNHSLETFDHFQSDSRDRHWEVYTLTRHTSVSMSIDVDGTLVTIDLPSNIGTTHLLSSGRIPYGETDYVKHENTNIDNFERGDDPYSLAEYLSLVSVIDAGDR